MSGLNVFAGNGVLTWDSNTTRACRVLGTGAANSTTVVTDDGFLTGEPWCIVLSQETSTDGATVVRASASFSGNQMTLTLFKPTTVAVRYIYGVY